MAVTIKDIAKAARVDKAAVSLTLRNRPEAQRLRPETRERILKTARELGYQRNLLASATRTGVVNTIAVIGRFRKNDAPPCTNRMLAGILTTCTQYGYNIKVYSDLNLDEVFAEIGGSRIFHVISLLVKREERQKTADFCKRGGIRLVHVYEDASDGFPSVNTDNFASAREVVNHLASIGHRRIALLCAPHRYLYIRERHDGYLRGLRDAGLQSDPRLIDCSENSEQGAAAMLALPEKERPTAIFALADSLAVRAEYLAIRQGFRVPEDLSVFGFGNTEICGAALVPVSSVEESPYDCGELAVKIILDKPADVRRREDGRYLIAPRLVHRDSTAPRMHGCGQQRNNK